MRRVWLLILTLTLCLSGCSNIDNSLSNGRYVAEQSSLVHIEFDLKEQTFTFVHTSLLSYFPSGTFNCKDGKVFAIHGEDTYVFKIVDHETILFLKSESAPTPLDEEMVFKLKE